MPPIRAAGVERAPPLPAAARAIAIAIVVGIGPNDDEPPVVEAVTGEMVGAGEVRHHAMATMAAVARIRGGRRAYRRQQRQRSRADAKRPHTHGLSPLPPVATRS